MNHKPHCIPCILRRTLHTAEIATSDEWLHRKLLAEIMRSAATADAEATPAEVVHKLFRKTARTLGMADPYAAEKKRWRDEILANEAFLRQKIDAAADPLVAALKFSVLANQLDNELRPVLTLKSLIDGMEQSRFEPDCLDALLERVAAARSVLFVHDAAGELFFDRLLIERLGKPREAVTCVVRKAPVIADATREDAEAIGLGAVAAEIVDPGVDCLGLPLGECSDAFRKRFQAADLVLVKGQAGYQTLEGAAASAPPQPPATAPAPALIVPNSLSGPPGSDGNLGSGGNLGPSIFFLFTVKCPVMATRLGAKLGDPVIEED